MIISEPVQKNHPSTLSNDVVNPNVEQYSRRNRYAPKEHTPPTLEAGNIANAYEKGIKALEVK